MKKRIFNIIRMFFISPEILMICVSIMFYFLLPDFLIKIVEEFIKKTDASFNFILLIPCGVIGFIFTQMNKLLSPENYKEIFYQWKDYDKLKDGLILSIAWIVFSIISLFLIWLYREQIDSKLIGCIFINASLVCIVVALTTFNATFVIDRILTLYTKRKE